MKKKVCILNIAISFMALLNFSISHAQKHAYYWGLNGNKNATVSSKIGTINPVPLRFVTNNKERMKILSTGNIGIGTSSPASKLHVAGSQILAGNLFFTKGSQSIRFPNPGAASEAMIYMYKSGTRNASRMVLSHSSNNKNSGLRYDDVRDRFDFLNNGKSRFSIGLSTGNIGISTSDPFYKLDVKGTISGAVESYDSEGNTTDGGYGVLGTGTIGVQAASDYRYGIGLEAFGFWGITAHGSDVGIYAIADDPDSYGTGILARGSIFGVYSEVGDFATGVYGSATNNIGISGNSITGFGIYGRSENSFAGFFDGALYASSSFQTSDEKLKQDIEEVHDALSIINKLKPKYYNFRDDGIYAKLNLPMGKHYGLLAQDLERVLPQLVKDASHDVLTQGSLFPEDKAIPGKLTLPKAFLLQKDKTKQQKQTVSLKAVNYIELIPILVKGMQEQDAENKALKEEVAALKQMVLELKNTIQERVTLSTTSGYLEQNNPNPATGKTIIRYQVPLETLHASITITNMEGQLIKSIIITNKGGGQVLLNGNLLASGTYNYTLVADGKQIATKRLIIAN